MRKLYVLAFFGILFFVICSIRPMERDSMGSIRDREEEIEASEDGDSIEMQEVSPDERERFLRRRSRDSISSRSSISSISGYFGSFSSSSFASSTPKTLSLGITQGSPEKRVLEFLGADESLLEKNYKNIDDIFEACEFGDIEKLRKIIEEDDSFFYIRNEFGRTILHVVALYGHLDLVKWIVEKESQTVGKEEQSYIEIEDDSGLSALYNAGFFGHFDIVRYLESKGAQLDANKPNKLNQILLHKAAALGTLEDVRYLVEQKGSALDVQDKHFSSSPLFGAVEMCKYDIVEYLVLAGCDLNLRDFRGFTAAEQSGFNGDLKILQFLVKQGSDIDFNKVGLPLKAEYSFSEGCDDFKDFKWSMLHFAALHAKPGLTKYLIDHGANVNTVGGYGNTPLHLLVGACGKKSRIILVAKILLQNGADINIKNDNGKYPIHLAAERADLDLIRVFNKTHNGVLNTLDSDHKTPLELVGLAEEFTGEHKCSKYIKYALQKEDGIHPLKVAVIEGNLSKAYSLIKKGKNVNFKDSQGNFLLHIACYSQNRTDWAIVKLLIKNGADVNALNKDKETSLHIAAKNGRGHLLELLVGQGGNIFKRNKQKKRVLEVAQEYKGKNQEKKNEACILYLERAHKTHKRLNFFLEKLKQLQEDYDIKNKRADQMNFKIPVVTTSKRKKGEKELKKKQTKVDYLFTLNQLVYENAKKIKKLISNKKLIESRDLIPISRQYAMHRVLELGLHKKYPELFPVFFVKEIVKDISLKTFLLNNPEFMEIVLNQEDVIDSNGFYPYQKMAYYTNLLPLILMRYKKEFLYKKNSMKRLLGRGRLKWEEKGLSICMFLAKSLWFAKKKKLKKYRDCFEVFWDFERKFKKFRYINESISKKNHHIKDGVSIAYKILKYSHFCEN